jgi:hypothetical protein
MPEEYKDPSANTQAFQAWVDNQANAQPAERPRAPLMIGAAVVGVLVLVLVVFLLMS